MHERHTIDCDILPKFTAAYLRVAGDECAFIETHTPHAVPKLLSELAARGRRPGQVRWAGGPHAHLDHASGASALLAKGPDATLLAPPPPVPPLADPSNSLANATH